MKDVDFGVWVSDIVSPDAKEATSDFFYKNGSWKKIMKSDFFNFSVYVITKILYAL